MRNVILLFGVVLLSGCGVWQDSQNALAKSMAEIRDCKVADFKEKCVRRVKVSYDEDRDSFKESDLNEDKNIKDEFYLIGEKIVDWGIFVINTYYNDGVLLIAENENCVENVYFRDGSKAIVSSEDEKYNCQYVCFNGNVVQEEILSEKIFKAAKEAAKNNDINLIDKALREICGGGLVLMC